MFKFGFSSDGAEETTNGLVFVNFTQHNLTYSRFRSRGRRSPLASKRRNKSQRDKYRPKCDC
jgi:hypothetical protein